MPEMYYAQSKPAFMNVMCVHIVEKKRPRPRHKRQHRHVEGVGVDVRNIPPVFRTLLVLAVRSAILGARHLRGGRDIGTRLRESGMHAI